MWSKIVAVLIVVLCIRMSHQQRPDYCQLKPESGFCEAYIPSFYYNPASGDCESFVYGGCGGNQNRFGSQQLCASTCLANV
ncbi:kunitz-like toxin PcKuz3 [Physella acuta]|uniref:kunitz-like toxin PcKuz3 n=1 Tax=Physella acuta TaxID=109671 RepID=UPI0027DC3B0C|nr:kunitz-like toxin PcKuz3 [Physella acuta]